MALETIGKKALEAKKTASRMNTATKNKVLSDVADQIIADQDSILMANEIDLENARKNGMNEGLQDRLRLTPERLQGIASAIEEVVALDDPIGEVLSMKKRPNGLLIGQKRVPLGVVGVIYEARPNVTADVFSLCFKTGNAVILKGGKDAFNSNLALVNSIQKALVKNGLPADLVQLITDNSREVTREFMKMNGVLDVLIPRGGASLIQSTVENATVPVIETGTGNCHIFVDESADFDKALDIIDNAKTQRIGVCNALESLVVHEKVADEFLPLLVDRLSDRVEIRIDPALHEQFPDLAVANEKDWGTEYLDYILSVKEVPGIDEAIDHINQYSTGHSESILSNDYANIQRFMDEIDSAAVYANASTRFTDGNEFGYGAEIGISTQKLHARGPMGLDALTSTKFIIYGDGQIRP